jgi:hypothetical protein
MNVQQHGAPPPVGPDKEGQPQPPADPEEEAPPQTRFGLAWNPDWRIVTIKQASATDFDDHLENTVLLGILLLIKHHLSSNDSSLTVRPRSTMSGSTFQGLHYGNQCTTMYDCIFMFANVGMQGKCFAIITTSPTESSKILKYCNYSDYCTLGNNFAIMERDSQSSFLQDSPIVAAMNSITLIQRLLGLNEVPLLDRSYPGQAMVLSLSRPGYNCNEGYDSLHVALWADLQPASEFHDAKLPLRLLVQSQWCRDHVANEREIYVHAGQQQAIIHSHQIPVVEDK